MDSEGSHKYVYKVRVKNGNGFRYIYPEDLKQQKQTINIGMGQQAATKSAYENAPRSSSNTQVQQPKQQKPLVIDVSKRSAEVNARMEQFRKNQEARIQEQRQQRQQQASQTTTTEAPETTTATGASSSASNPSQTGKDSGNKRSTFESAMARKSTDIRVTNGANVTFTEADVKSFEDFKNDPNSMASIEVWIKGLMK